MKTIKNEETKGIVFTGCSFTWGQGLYYYSNLATLQEPGMYRYDGNIVTSAHKRYMQSFRFPRLVANHFNTFEVVSENNGGRDMDSFNFLKKVFGLVPDNELCHYLINDKFYFKEIEYIVFQTSQVNRNTYYYEFENGMYEYRLHQPETYDRFYRYLSFNNLELEDALKDLAKVMFKNIKNTLEFYESCGVKTLLLHWENEYSELTNNDEWMKERLITFEYNNKPYKSILDLMMENRHLEISEDYTKFIVPPKDGHPSLECNKIIADAVIKKIEETKFKKIRYEKKLI
jgi:hypothetical protein